MLVISGISNMLKERRAADGNLTGFCDLLAANGIEYRLITYYSKRHNETLPENALGVGIMNVFKIVRILLNADSIFVYSGHALVVIFWVLLSKIFSLKVFYYSVELRSSKGYSGVYHFLNNTLIDSPKFYKFLGISIFAVSKKLLNRFKPCKVLYFPPLIGEKALALLQSEMDEGANESYFLYCGSAGYSNAINKLLDVFALQNNIRSNLILVLSGALSKEMLTVIGKNPKIKLYQNIPYSELYRLYNNSIANILPLNTSLEDYHRFPNKFAEYINANSILLSSYHPDFREIISSPFISEDVSKDVINVKTIKVLESLHNTERTNIILSQKTVGKNFTYLRTYEEVFKTI